MRGFTGSPSGASLPPAAPLLTTREVAALLGLSPATVLRRWRTGELPGFRISSNCLRFDACELEAWLEARRR